MAISQGNNHTFSSGQLVTADKLNKVKVVQTGTTAENTGHTGPAGQLTYDTDTSKLRVHDGSTAGGKVLTSSPIDSSDIGEGAVGASQLADNAVGQDQLATGAVGSDQLASDAVTNEKIATGAVSTDSLQESGTGAISVQQIVPKTLVIHVGNYHYQGTKYWASDAFNYNAGTDMYEARTSITRDFTANTSVGVKGWATLHYDLKETLIVEPFATYIAGLRYVLQNHGVGCNVTVIFHGHVCAYGTYDLYDTSTNHYYKDVNNFDNFAKISLQGGAPPDYSDNSADYQVFQSNGVTPARIDHDSTVRHQIGAQGSNLAYWYRGPIMNVVGTNQVFTSNEADAVSVRYGIGINHNLGNNRMASTGSVTYFKPYVFLEGTIAYFSSGSGNPNEWYFNEGGKLFEVIMKSGAVYSNNGQNHIYIDGSDTSNHLIEFATIGNSSSFDFKNNSNVYYKSGKTFKAFGSGQFPVFMSQAFNKFGTVSDDFFVGENGVGHTGATLAEAFNFVTHDGSGTIQTTGTRDTYTNIATEDGTLHKRYSEATGFHSSSATLNATRLCGHSNVKSAPGTRQGTGGTSNASAPYSDQ